jgi:two-component system CheB/CheR fusion protein
MTSSEHARPLHVVGIGASAGGIRALQEFFARAPTGAGITYVVILHLSPDYDSKLAEILQTTTAMPVEQVRGRVAMAPDHVYVIPPNGSLTIADGRLTVADVTGVEQRRAPVDVFFRALAQAHGPHAVAVVLSGTGPNGSSGLKAVKEHGGLAIVQDPAEAEYREMPANSIATGLVDYVLRVGDIPGSIGDYYGRLNSGDGAASPDVRLQTQSDLLPEILTLLRVRTGHDFSGYKPATIVRRIERRIHVRALAGMAEYAALLRQQPDETISLMKELLISVTSFFRDPEAYAVLERRIVPKLFHFKQPDDQVRVWVPGCATGEEAYSVAMLLAECASTSSSSPTVQIFATDLDQHAVSIAREGLYAEAEVADVPEERVRRFFQREPNGFRVRRELRELVLFAHHNVIRDPPFSHLDLIACRNVLIYLNRAVQDSVIETFHFALRPGGHLFLGTSETADGDSGLFVIADKNAHIYESRTVTSRPLVIAREPVSVVAPRPQRRLAEAGPLHRVLPADLHHRLLDEYAPPSLVVNEQHDVVHMSERAAQYLELPAGEPSRDVLKLVWPEARTDLRAALHQAARQRTAVEVRGVSVPAARGGGRIRIIIRPVLREGDAARGYFLIVFDADDPRLEPTEPAAQVARPRDGEVGQLEEELSRVQEQLRTAVEQYETQGEEAKASNEELQAMNEELRSAAEELETSKEELQSVNEELMTVNQELKIKIEELALTNNDFQNFINSTDIGTIFLDGALRVKFATARARDVFNLVPGDIGRPLSDITSTLHGHSLHADIKLVLERLQTIEREVQSDSGGWYLVRVLPYRTTDNRIDGVVVTFVEITARREAELSVKASEERLRLLIDSAIDYAIFTMTDEGRIDSWNSGAERMFGYSAEEILGQYFALLFTPEDRDANVPDQELTQARSAGRASDERFHVRRNGTRFYCSGVTTLLGGRLALGFAKIARDLTRQRVAEEELKAAQMGLEQRVQRRTRELQDEVIARTKAQEHATSLLRRLVTAQEDQRGRIARDLHDEVGQQLTALRLTLDRCRERSAEGGGLDEELDHALALAREIDASLDFLAWELRPAALDDLGLAAALPRFVEQWSDHYRVPAEFRLSGFASGDLSREAEVTFYRIAQEALNNVVKHAHATRVDVILERREGSVILVIEDDGIGFDPLDREFAARGLGLMGMRERAALTGATLDVESAPGEGTTIFLRCAVVTGEAREPAL